MNDGKGYIRLYRKSHHSRFGPVTEKREFTHHEAWEDLLFRAVWNPNGTKAMYQNREPIHLQPGEVLTTLEQLRQHWRWKSRNRVRRFLRNCESFEMIKFVTMTAGKPAHLKIVNAETYGLVRNNDESLNGTTMNPSANPSAIPVEEVKKKKKKRSKPSEGMGFWDKVESRWQTIAEKENLPRLRGLSETRRSHYRERVKENPDFWEVIEREVPRLGDKYRQWFNFPWVIKSPDNFTKLAEGNYREKDKPDARSGQANLEGRLVEIRGGPSDGARGRVISQTGKRIIFFDQDKIDHTVHVDEVEMMD